MKLQLSTVDVGLSILDQQSPVLDAPMGRLTDLVNAKVTKYQNPRAADGTVTHVRVEKRDAFATLTNAVVDEVGNTLAPLSGAAQILFGGGDVTRQVIKNRLYSLSGSKWVKASNPTDGDAIVFPQVVRSQSLYAADSQVEGATLAIISDVACVVWREVSVSASNNSSSPTLSPTPLNGVRIEFRNVAEKSTLVPPFTYDAAGGAPDYQRVTVLVQNGQFWVLQDYDNGTDWTIWISIFDTSGKFVAKTSVVVGTLGTVTGADRWDATVVQGEGVVIATPSNGGVGVHFDCYTYAGSFTHTQSTDSSIGCGGKQVGWLRDDSPANNIAYLVSLDTTIGIYVFTAHQVISMASTKTYPSVTPLVTISPGTTAVSGITGYKVPGTTDVVVAYSTMDLVGVPDASDYNASSNGINTSASDHFPNQLNNTTTTHYVPFTGSSSRILTRHSIALASRAFPIGDDYVAIGYYPACKLGPLDTLDADADHFPQRPINPSDFQPTYYVLPLNSKQQIAGRLEYGLAARDEQVITWNGTNYATGPRNRCLADVVPTPSFGLMTVLGYRVEQNIPNPASFTEATDTNAIVTRPNWVATPLVINQVYQSSATVGAKLFTFGPDCGQPFVVGQTTYFPGLMACVVEPGDTTITEHAIIAPECPRVVKSSTASTIAANNFGQYIFRLVAESTTSSGREYRSLPSAAFAYTIKSGENFALAVSASTCSLTNRKSAKVSVYRSGFVNAQISGSAVPTTPATVPPSSGTGAPTYINAPTTGLFKVSNDLTPFYTNDGVATAVFTDMLSSGTQASGEELYVDSELPRFPAPAFRSGCMWQNRAWLVGYDNAVWFSAELTENDGTWFNTGFRCVVPTNEEVTAIAPMDNFLLVFCANSIWYIPAGAQLPDATGNGTIPAPVRLPFEQGCTGFASVIGVGCAYSASTGGIWLVTRSLENEFLGHPAQEFLSAIMTGMTVAGTNLIVSNEEGFLIVYDTVLGAWGRWYLPVFPDLITASASTLLLQHAGVVWQQQPGAYQDQDTNNSNTYYVSMSATVSPVHLGGVAQWKRTWKVQLRGQVLDFCSLTRTLTYDDYGLDTFTYDPKQLGPGAMKIETRPSKQLTTSMGVTLTDSAPVGNTVTTGQGFAWEMASFDVGLEKGSERLPASAR